MKWFKFIFLFLLLSSCAKESIKLETQELNIATDNDIYDIVFLDENIAYACGGELWKSGFIAKSEDGGTSWNIVYEHFNIIFELEFLNENKGIAGAFWGGILKTEDGGNSWDYEEYPDMSACNSVHFLNDSSVLICTGSSYHFGGLCQYNFNSSSLSFSDYLQSFEASYFFDEEEGVLCSYGVIYKTYDGGNSLVATNGQGDFFKVVDFNQQGEGLAVGYEGKILSSKNKGSNWDKSTNKSRFFTTKGNLEGLSVYNKNAFVCGENGSLFYTSNFFDSWLEVEHNYEHANLRTVYIKNESEAIIAGSDGLIFKIFF